ncbi:hypothetical protein GCM10010052_08000 [Paenarthrobacter histidinolovorans]|nr:hypothetical protein GCM10010052_08000 [Paenarthrobacter histidinolovorans]
MDNFVTADRAHDVVGHPPRLECFHIQRFRFTEQEQYRDSGVVEGPAERAFRHYYRRTLVLEQRSHFPGVPGRKNAEAGCDEGLRGQGQAVRIGICNHCGKGELYFGTVLAH